MDYLNKTILSIASIAVITMTGCSQKTVYVDRPVEVKIPVKCEVPVIEKPKQGNNMSESMLNIKEYILKLEAALDSCR